MRLIRGVCGFGPGDTLDAVITSTGVQDPAGFGTPGRSPTVKTGSVIWRELVACWVQVSYLINEDSPGRRGGVVFNVTTTGGVQE